MVLLLCKAGWYNQNPEIAYNCPLDNLFKAYYFEIMTRQYKTTLMELNKER